MAKRRQRINKSPTKTLHAVDTASVQSLPSAEMLAAGRARAKQYRELAECRANSVAAKQIEKGMRLRSLAASTGDPLSAIEASKLVGCARETVEVPAVGNGGEIIPHELPDVVDTVRDPNIMSATASFQRVGLANAAGVLDLAIDFADTFAAKNSLEKALCHQLALLHRSTMKTGAELVTLEQYVADIDGPFGPMLERHSRLLSEIRRHRLLIARSVEVFTQVAQGFRRFRGDHSRQHITVEKIVVAGGGKAVIGAQVDGGGGSTDG